MYEETIIVRSKAAPLLRIERLNEMCSVGPALRAGVESIDHPDAAMEIADGVEIAFENLTASQRDALRADPEIAAVGTSMPTRLIEPVATMEADAAGLRPWGLEAVGALSSPWTGAGVRVAVLDTGIDKEHEAFSGIPLHDMNLVDFTGEGAADRHGHGTHCAGTIFGRTVGGVRIGVAPGVDDVLIGKVLGQVSSTSAMLFRGMDWAIASKANVISMSLGFDVPGFVARLARDGWPQDLAVSAALLSYRGNLEVFNAIMAKVSALNRAGNALAEYDGSLILAATGNESRASENSTYRIGASLPAASAGVYAVGALDRAANDRLAVASFSNGGPAFCAPGVDILSARLGGGTVSMSGTSMATPHAAGVAALWAQKLLADGVADLPRAIGARMSALASRSRIDGAVAFDCGDGLVDTPHD